MSIACAGSKDKLLGKPIGSLLDSVLYVVHMCLVEVVDITLFMLPMPRGICPELCMILRGAYLFYVAQDGLEQD